MACALALKHVFFHVRNIRLRLPFRFGVITLREVALLHLAIEVDRLTSTRGTSARPRSGSSTAGWRVETLAAGA